MVLAIIPDGITKTNVNIIDRNQLLRLIILLEVIIRLNLFSYIMLNSLISLVI